MGDTGELVLECVGRGDGRCPRGEVGVPEAGMGVFRCVDCRDFWELDETEPWRRPREDD
jgi:hypothetical protein